MSKKNNEHAFLLLEAVFSFMILISLIVLISGFFTKSYEMEKRLKMDINNLERQDQAIIRSEKP